MASSLSCLSITNARGSLLLQASRDASSVKNRPQHHLSLLTKTNINSCPLSSATRTNCRRRRRESNIVRMESRSESAVTQVIEKAGIKIVRNPSESHLSQLRVRSWPKWGCPPSKFPWTYSAKETCYLLEGEVKVYPDGLDEAVEIGAGDLVEFPKGMSCTWDVSVGVDKHYNFE